MWFKKKRTKDSKIMKQIRKQRFVVLSPLTLGFVTLTVLGFALPNHVFGATCSISPGTITHTLIHSSFDHWFNNVSLILLLMPSCEDHFGMSKLFKMICVVATMSWFANALFTNYIPVGASGVVFMLIVLTPFIANAHETTNVMIPVCFVMVFLMFLGKEIYVALTQTDHVSHLCHVVGGIVGAVFALKDRREIRKSSWFSQLFSALKSSS